MALFGYSSVYFVDGRWVFVPCCPFFVFCGVRVSIMGLWLIISYHFVSCFLWGICTSPIVYLAIGVCVLFACISQSRGNSIVQICLFCAPRRFGVLVFALRLSQRSMVSVKIKLRPSLALVSIATPS